MPSFLATSICVSGFVLYNPYLNDIIDFCSIPRSMTEIMEHIGLRHRYNVKHRYIDPLIEGGFLVMTIPEKPNSRDQKYKRALT